jgi:fatty-acyl-CoA synthase
MTGLRVDISPAAAVHKLSRHSPDRTAIVYSGRSIGYGELAGAVGRLAMVLADGGVGRGDRVAYIGLNSPTFLTTFLAAAWIGAVFVPVDFRLAADEVRHVLDDSAAHTLVVEVGHRAVVTLAAERIPVRQRLLVDDDPAVGVDGDSGSQWVSLSSAATTATTPGEPQPCHDQDVAMLAYTSGTTGRAKGVTISHGSLWWNGANLDCVADMRADDVNLVVAPLFHTAPLGCFTLRSLVRGGTSVVRRSFDAAQTLADLVELRVNTFFAVPAMYTAIARLPRFASANLSGLRTAVVAGAPAPPALIAEYADHGVLLQQAYGLTETLFSTCLPAAKIRQKMGSVGVALPFTQIRLVEENTGHEITEPGVPGEVCMRGPTVTQGYWNNAAATAAAFDAGGWFHSGDIGYVDAEGFLYIIDRIKDMIIVGGDNVYLADVERVLIEFPGILDVAVVGVPDETWGERVVAVLSCPDGVLPSLAEIRRFAEPHLASYKLPSRLHAIDAVPRNVMGKIDRNAIHAGLATGSFAPVSPAATSQSAATSPPAVKPSATDQTARGAEPASNGRTVPGIDSQSIDADSPSGGGRPEWASEWAERFAGLSPPRQYRLVLQLVTAHIAEMLEQPLPTELPAESKLEDLGLGSLSAVELSNRLSTDTGLPLPTTLIFDYPTVGALIRYICAELAVPSTGHDPATPLALLGELEEALASSPPDGENRSRIVARLQGIISGLTAT